jgi:hypothetical protein
MSEKRRTNNALESFVEDILTKNGYEEFINYKNQIFIMRKTIGEKQFFKKAVSFG